MDPLSKPLLGLIADRFKLLSSPTRLEILQHICGSELTVSALVEVTQFKQANVSKHLGLLDRAGLVTRRVDGQYVYYAVADETLPKLCEIIRGSIQTRQGEIQACLDT